MVHKLYNAAVDVVFPRRCAGCQIWSQELFCPACYHEAQPIITPFCIVCGKPFDTLAYSAAECAECRPSRTHGAPPFRALRAAYAFEGPMREAIHRFKYHGKTALAAPLAHLLHEYLRPPARQRFPQDCGLPCDEFIALIPVPLHPWRRYRRGFNQSALLAGKLAQLLHIPTVEALRRTRYTTPQVGLSAKDRVDNVKGAFAINKAIVARLKAQGGPVLLVDDVCTTSSTLRECAAVLKQGGIGEVYGLTLARQV